MTRSVTIVNTSNWDEEPYMVNGVLLMPGEMLAITEYEMSVELKAVNTTRSPRPYSSGGDNPFQILPEVRVAWVKTKNAMLGYIHGEVTIREPTE